MKTEITKIRFQLKDRSIELTADEAREVQKELNHLFEIEKTELEKLKEQLKKEQPVQIAPLNPPYYVPIIIERERVPYWPQKWEIWCGEIGSNIGTNAQETGTLQINVDTKTYESK